MLSPQVPTRSAVRLGLAPMQPAAEGDAVGLVDDAVRVELVQVLEDRAAHQLGVERGDAVDAVRAEEGEVAHAHVAAAVLVDQRQRRELFVGHVALTHVIEVVRVDLIDDLHVAREHPLEERHRPRLQRFGQQRVVGVGRACGR